MTQIDHGEEAANGGAFLDVGALLEGPYVCGCGREETNSFELWTLVRHEPHDVLARGANPDGVERAAA